MLELTKIEEKFEKHGGVLKTSDLIDVGLSTRQIERLLADGVLTKVKYGYYGLTDFFTPEDVIIARLFPRAVLFLESALSYYEYTDRIPSAWQIAVDKDSAKGKYNISYPRVVPFYIEPRFLDIGVDTYHVDGVTVRIYNRERTICDVLRYESKLEKEVFSQAIQSYIKDKQKNVRRLIEYSGVFNIRDKVQTYIGVWL